MANSEFTDTQVLALKSVSKGTTSFALDLYNVLKNEPGNLFFSPLSLQLVLALAYSGAKSTTAEEIAKALLLPEKLDDVLEGYSLLLRFLDDPSLSVANKMFIEESFQLFTKFQTSADKYFKAGADQVPFIKNSEEARNKINKWVESKTNNKIQELLGKGVVSAETKLLLVNAIHFKADWSIKFDEKQTKRKPFHVSKTETIDTEMMHITKKLLYLYDEKLEAKALKLTYFESDLAMIILLPDAVDGLAELETKLKSVDLSETFLCFSETKTQVQLPKFKLETTLQLNNILKKMGIKTMFTENADFTGISSRDDLVVSDVIQKAFVEVNEKGTEAAAATVMAIRMKRALPLEDYEDFIADHPFLFFITNNEGSVIIFLGRYAQPEVAVGVGGHSHEEL